MNSLHLQDSEGVQPDISVVIPSWNTLELTRDCLRSLLHQDQGCTLQVIVVDNGSHDGSADMVAREFPQVLLIRNERNEYFSKACNQGASVAKGRYICYLNSDTIVTPKALRRMMEFLETHPAYGAVAPRLDNPDGSVQPICRRFPKLIEVAIDQFGFERFEFARRYRDHASMKDFDHLSSADVEQPPGACLLMRRSDVDAIGGFDESMPLFYSDVDLCLRIWRSGRPIRFLAEARIFHVGSASIVRHPLWRAEFMRNQVRYFRKHGGVVHAFAAKAIILTSAILVAIRTLLGPRPLREKRDLIGQLGRSMQIVLGG
ncbi:glycosyltransferase family 2 protein [Caldimonas manganoxidans]|uniref:glycosyltransferase family 2 protein n=1 Tax=Caldimonas manganoxidans TaxID=196015 RepID=UPI000524BE52|nr:glycosyltransferase family 2 protein [Caldimonas manganoxidans]